jgi:peptidyl-prolyl cis-trans isomerase D
LLASFCFWNIPGGKSNGDLLTSGKSVIRTRTYQIALKDAIFRSSYKRGRSLTSDEIKQLSIGVLSRLDAALLLSEQARKMNIAADDDSVIQMLGDDTFFWGKERRFDKKRFIDYLQQISVTQSDFLRYLTSQLKRNQVLAGILGGLEAPRVLQLALLSFQQETRRIEYLELTPSSIGWIADPDKKTLEVFFKSKKDKLFTPEYRKITYMRMNVEDVIRLQDVAQKAVVNCYEKNKESYSVPEKRIVDILSFKTPENAHAAAEKLAGGLSFDQLVAENKKFDIRYGPLTEADLPPLIASEVFSLDKGGVSHVIKNMQGSFLIRVVDVLPAGPIPSLAKLQDKIRYAIARKVALKSLYNKRKTIENARFDGASLKEVASDYGLSAKEVIIDADGKGQDGKRVHLPFQANFLKNAFQSAADIDVDPLDSDEGYLWYHVDKIFPSHKPLLNEGHDELTRLWKEQQVQSLLEEKAEKIKRELDQGNSLHVVADKYKLVVKMEDQLRRTAIGKKIGMAGMKEVFSARQGSHGIAIGADDQSRFVFKIIRITKSDGPLSESENQYDLERFREDLEEQFVALARYYDPVKMNTKLLSTVLQ